MRIVIVDDESIVIKGISHIIKKYCPEHEVAGCFTNAKDAMAFMRKTNDIDVVFTDIKMPEISGIELIKAIKNTSPEVHIIVISAYSDFETVKESMKCGARDYLLKPCKHMQIIEMLNSFFTDKSAEMFTLNNRKDEDALHSIILGKTPPNGFNGSPFGFIAVLQPEENLLRFPASFMSNLARDRVRSVSEGERLVLFLSEEKDQSQTEIYIMGLISTLREWSVRVFAAISPAKTESLRTAYETCLKITEFMRFNDIDGFMLPDDYEKHMQHQKDIHFSDFVKFAEVTLCLVRNDVETLRMTINESFKMKRREKLYIDPCRLKGEAVFFIIDIEKWIEKKYGQTVKLGILESLMQSATLNEFASTFTKKLQELLLCIAGEEIPQYINEAKNYISSHYMEDISLKDVANHVFMNAWHFSTQFKRYVSMPLSEYLTRVRINAAKELLSSRDLKVYQVAEMVGFSDPTYFSTVFKSFEGISPKDYKKLMV